MLRVVRGGPYIPTAPRSGNIGDSVIWRKSNMITRGRDNGLQYEECFAGAKDQSQNLAGVALTGTLALAASSTTITGTATLFLTECHIGQQIVVPNGANTLSWLLVVDQIISNTSMVVAKAPDATNSGLTGYRMPIAFPVNDQIGSLLHGNVLKLDKGSYLSVGDGIFRVNGAALSGSSLTATKHPQLSLLNTTTGAYTNFPLGMDTSTAPTLASVAGGTKGMQAASYSIVITPGRTQTGGYNNPSPRADVVLAAGDKIQITFPAMDTTAGQNQWNVWGTLFSESLGTDKNYLNGPWYFVRNVTDAEVSSAGGNFSVEWLDAEIERNDIITFDNDEPVDAEFVCMLNAVPVYLSCQGQGNSTHTTATSPGPFIVPAKFTNIEAAPLSTAFSSSPPETIIGFASAQGRIYLLTTNHLQIAQATPDPSVPVLIRPFWKDGFKNANQLTFVNGTLYGYPNSGPSRSVGDGDESEAEKDWAAYVAEFTNTWVPGQVMVGHDPSNNAICFFHSADTLNSSGYWTTRVLMYGLAQGQWIGDITLSSTTEDQIVSGVATVGDNLVILVGGRNASTPRVKTKIFDVAAGDSIAWYLAPQLTDFGEEQRNKTIKSARVTARIASGSFQVYTYGPTADIDVSALEAGTGSATGAVSLTTTTQVVQSQRYQLNCPNAAVSTVRVAGTYSGSGDKARIDEIVLEAATIGARI